MSFPRFHHVALILLVATALAAVPASAQWSSSSSTNTPVIVRSGGQFQPKISPRADGGFYVSWFDNNPNGNPAYGYDVYVQRLDAGGVGQFSGGALIADLGLSSTQDYGLDQDSSGNGLVAFLDDRNSHANPQVTAAKITASGTQPWGTLGVRLTSDASFHANPKIAGTSDGNAVVAWVSDSKIVLQKLSPSGLPLWGNGITLSESGANYSVSDLHSAGNGSVILSYVRDTGFFSNRHLLAQKISGAGALMWGTSGVNVFDGGSLQFGNFPRFVADGAGGAVFGWYSSSPGLQSFAQHLDTNGSELFPHNGSLGSTNGADIQVEPSVSYRAATGEVFLFWTEEDQFQTVIGVSGQKFNSTGTRQWGDSGVTVVPKTSTAQIFVNNVQSQDGALVSWISEPSFGQDTISATRYDNSGNVACKQFYESSFITSKSRPVAAVNATTGMALTAWEDSRNPQTDIYAQNVNADCTLGYVPLKCSDVTPPVLTCSNHKLKVTDTLTGLTHDGDRLTFSINGASYAAPITGRQATVSVTGIGSNTVQLTNPSGCYAPKTVQCQ